MSRRASSPAVALLLVLLLGAAGCVPPQRGTIGAILARNQETGEVRVHEVPEGLAADHAGLRPGDRILLIDGVDVRALGERELYAALNGGVGQPVKLTVERGEGILRLTVRRTPAAKYPLSPSP